MDTENTKYERAFSVRVSVCQERDRVNEIKLERVRKWEGEGDNIFLLFGWDGKRRRPEKAFVLRLISLYMHAAHESTFSASVGSWAAECAGG